MADPAFRAEQWRLLYAPHIEPINRLVDELGRDADGGSAPYVAPLYGGTSARMLSVLSDPGPKADAVRGSGFLCLENDNVTAETMCKLLAEAGISAKETLPWNVYPWYINRKPTAAQLGAGVLPMLQLLKLLPRLKVVMLHGRSAHTGWRKLVRRQPSLVADRGLTVIETYHTSRQAFWHRDPAVRQARMDHLQESLEQAGRIMACCQDEQEGPGPSTGR